VIFRSVNLWWKKRKRGMKRFEMNGEREEYLRMTRDGDELTRETTRGTEESPMGLWDKSSSIRFVK